MIGLDSLPATVKLPHRALGGIFQLGHVVRDLAPAMRSYTQLLGIGPWIVLTDIISVYRLHYRGLEVKPKMTVAFSYIGDMQIELIQQHDQTPTPYQAFLESGREGLHHFGFMPSDYQAAQREMEGAGLRSVFDLWPPGSNVPTQYFESPQGIGLLFEVVAETPQRKAAFGAMKSAVDHWDGKTLVREYRTFADFVSDKSSA